jgi:hypothetical protein
MDRDVGGAEGGVELRRRLDHRPLYRVIARAGKKPEAGSSERSRGVDTPLGGEALRLRLELGNDGEWRPRPRSLAVVVSRPKAALGAVIRSRRQRGDAFHAAGVRDLELDRHEAARGQARDSDRACIRALRRQPIGREAEVADEQPGKKRPHPGKRLPRSRSTSRAQLWPGAPVTPPPGCAPDPHRYRPRSGVR